MMAINTDVALMELDEFKEFLSNGSDDDFLSNTKYDSKLEKIIDAIGRLFNTYTDRHLLEKAHTEYYDGDGTDELYLLNTPIISTISTIEVYIDTERAYGADTKRPSTDIILYQKEGLVRLESTVFSKAPQSVKVVYTAGYDLTAGEANVLPEDLRYAAMVAGGMMWKIEREKIFKTSSVTISGGSATFTTAEDFPPEVKTVLDLYVSYRHGAIR